MKSDIQIAQEAKMLPIAEVAKSLDIDVDDLELYGKYKAKISNTVMNELVENIINKCTDKPWRTFFLSFDNDTQLIAGGASQGIKVGDKFNVMTKGKKVKNPQTGVMIELPGKALGTVTVTNTAGDTPETEYSFVKFSGDASSIDAEKLVDYYIEEIK